MPLLKLPMFLKKIDLNLQLQRMDHYHLQLIVCRQQVLDFLVLDSHCIAHERSKISMKRQMERYLQSVGLNVREIK